MQFHIGTSGYSYKEWKGSFYPEKFPEKELLNYYGQHLTAVEINNTFYRFPKSSVLENWIEQVPTNFIFAIKASRKITHFKRLKNKGEEIDYLYKTVKSLKDQLGLVFFQLPPNFKIDLDRLKTFLDIIPEGLRAAFEFRHETWFDENVYDLLKSRDFALCIADIEDTPVIEIISSASWGYLRLRRQYEDNELVEWEDKIKSQNWQQVFVFFEHEEEGRGPQMAMKFKEIVDI